MGYARELKFQICKRIFDGGITVEEASVECGATIATIKKWVKLYTNECTNLYEFATEESLYQRVEELAYIDYNHVRPHSFNGYRTPFEVRNAA